MLHRKKGELNMYKIYNDCGQLVAQSNQEVDESILELLECLDYRIEYPSLEELYIKEKEDQEQVLAEMKEIKE
jgi:transposase